jgi:hypothetical protein
LTAEIGGLNAAARAKTPGIKRRSKTAANPWQGLPRLADLFDRATPQPFFKGSKVPGLEELAVTETHLLEQTAALLGVSLAQLLRTGALVYAKREFLNHKKYSAAAEGDPEAALLRPALACQNNMLDLLRGIPGEGTASPEHN